MHQRKKNQNKENLKTIKKLTHHEIHYTQELHIPTYATIDLRQPGRSIQLKKSSSKKPGSRKSRCISAKQAGPSSTLNMKQLLKQFKSMKWIGSRSKSPRSSKSKPKLRKSSKKMTQTQVNSKSNSEVNLTAKLQRTLQKLKQSHYFPEEESEIPLVSTSEAFTDQEKKKIEYLFSADNYDDINIKELRLFCKNKEPGIRMNLGYFKGNTYEMMARRIQRAWRRYRTHKLVQRYTSLTNQFKLQEDSDSESLEESIEDNENEHLMISSDQLYQTQNHKITYISNLEEELEEAKNAQKCEVEDTALYLMKKEQLEKWNQMISLIKNNRAQNPQETEKLMQQLISTSETNRRNLELKPKVVHLQQIANQYESIQEEPENIRIAHHESESSEKEDGLLFQLEKLRQQQKSSVSEESIKQIQEQFNSKKYIEYLDSDMYPITNHKKESFTTIGLKKQEALLSKLQESNSKKHGFKRPRLLDSGEVLSTNEQKSRLSYRSNSELSSMSSIDAEELKSSRRLRKSKLLEVQFKRSTSEKNIKYSEYSNTKSKNLEIKEEEEDDRKYDEDPKSPEEGQMIKKTDLKILDIQEKKKQDPEEESEILMRRELEKMDDDAYEFVMEHPDLDLDDDHQKDIEKEKPEKAFLEEEFKKQIEELHKLRDDDSDEQIETQHQRQPLLQRSSNQLNRIKNQEEHNVDSDEDNSDNGVEKGETIGEMLSNSLLIEFLIEMAKYPQTILKSFKGLTTKKKMKRAPSKAKKNGFTTNQAQIKSFIQDLCNYVLNEEPQIFKNLEKATGPSALEMLRYMHQSVENDIYIEEEEDDPSIMILPNWVFENLWTRKVQTLKYDRQGLEEEREKQRQEYLKGLNKIFLRSCFDCLNECLDYERNFGPFGKPFPWKKSHYFDHVKTLEQTKKSVTNSQKRLFDISSTYCGIIIQKDEIVSLGGNDEYISMVQDDRLSRMLAQDLVEGEERWIFYDDEETELLVEAANTIFQQILEQLMVDLSREMDLPFFP